MDYTKCPCCSHSRSKAHPKGVRVRVCSRCGAEFGDVGYKGDLYSWIGMGQWAKAPVPEDRLQYVDLTFLGSEGPGRWHGWVDRDTRRIVQVG